MTPSNPEALLSELRSKLRSVFALHHTGAGHELIRAQGYVDGFMRVLLDAGLVTRAELLSIVAEERHGQGGPAVREVSADRYANA